MSIFSARRNFKVRYRTGFSLLLLLLLPAGLQLSCEDTGTEGELKQSHVINIVHAHLGQSDQINSYLQIWRDNAAFDLAAIGVYNSVDTNAIALLTRVDSGTYSDVYAAFNLDATRQLMTEITTPLDAFQFRYTVAVPDTFSFAAPGLPGNIVRSSDGAVQLEWNAAQFAEGYFIVVEPVASGNNAAGYAELISSQSATGGSIPASAFRSTQGFEEGDYDVWVVAYRQSPISYPGIPFDLPAGFSDNIDRVGVDGRGGSMYIPSRLTLTAVSN
jgi:hypothetical protein